MCQLVRCRVIDSRGFREAMSRMPPDAWVPTYDNRIGHAGDGGVWTTLAALDVLREHGAPLEPLESLEAELIPVFYGPGASVHAKLMAADLRCCVLAAGAIGAVRAGEGAVQEVAGITGLAPEDLTAWQPPFSPPYVWLLIWNRDGARAAVDRLYPGNAAARQWADRFGVGSLESLLAQTQPGVPSKFVPDPA
jgi:hypothetical protein